MYIAFLNLGYTEIAVILLVAILIFGGKLPTVARDMGKKFFDLKRGLNDLNRDIYDITDTTTPPRYGETDPQADSSPYMDDSVHSSPYRSGDVEGESPKVEEDPPLDNRTPELDIDPEQWKGKTSEEGEAGQPPPAGSEAKDLGTDDSADPE